MTSSDPRRRPLEGRIAAVTGAGSGLGRRCALVLAGAGASVALMGRRRERLEDLAAEIRGAGGRAFVQPLDVADASAIGPALDAAERDLGPLAILVNNAGVGGAGAALELPVEAFDETFAVNVRAVFLGAREAARLMIASGEARAGRARIINIASIAAERVLPGLSAYCASKAAVAMLTRSLGREWARRGVAVNAICPGYIETEINADWFGSEPGRRQVESFPRRRLMEAGVLDDTLLLLAGDGAAAITGALFTIDDGQSL